MSWQASAWAKKTPYPCACGHPQSLHIGSVNGEWAYACSGERTLKGQAYPCPCPTFHENTHPTRFLGGVT